MGLTGWLFGKRHKARAELDYWIGLVGELTQNCRTDAEKKKALLDICWEVAFPRYKSDLYLDDDSFDAKRILDVGCGPHCGIIGFAGAEKHGVDHLIDQYKQIGYPLNEHGVQYRSAKSERLPFPADHFDAVLCVNALDHVDDLKRTVAEVARVLKPGGSFLGQVNFHSKPTATEPICLTHEKLLSLFSMSDLQIRNLRYQYTLDDGDEQRYYYEACKGAVHKSRAEFELP